LDLLLEKKREEMEQKIELKVILLGDQGVGKTSIMKRYLQDKYSIDEPSTIGAAFGSKKISVNGTDIVLGIWDTAGQERFDSMTRFYYRSARAAIICYDVNNKNTFKKAKFWVHELQGNERSCKMYLVGTKIDLDQRDVEDQEIRAYAQKVNARLFEVSSKTGQGIREVFDAIAQDYLHSKNQSEQELPALSTQIQSINQESQKPSTCC
jgi:Ras-related protein Rab-24